MIKQGKKMANYPAGFVPSHLALYFVRCLKHAVVSPLWSNQFLGRVAPSFFSPWLYNMVQ